MESIWFASCPIERREPLNRNLRTDVAVIGAGITGILTAYKLQKTGKEVVLLEANRIASGQTGKTTAKITSQHGLLYHRLIQDGGEEKARQYAQANENAIAAYRSLVREEQIDCDFETTDAYVYSQNAESLKKEALAAKKLGIAASFVQPARFPIDTVGAVRFQNQAQFHPIKLIAALSSKLTIYENTLVRSVDGNQIETNRELSELVKSFLPAITHLLIFRECTLPECIKNAPTSWHWKTQTHRTACGSARRNLPTPCAAGRISSCLVEKAIGRGKTGRAGVTAHCPKRPRCCFRAAMWWGLGPLRTASPRIIFLISAPIPRIVLIGWSPLDFKSGG